MPKTRNSGFTFIGYLALPSGLPKVKAIAHGHFEEKVQLGNRELTHFQEAAEFGSGGGLKYHFDWLKTWRHLQAQLEPARNGC